MVDSYPNYKPNNISETVDVWHMMLSDYDYNLVAMALKAYILSDTSGFAPSIGQLVAKMRELTTKQDMNENEAWSLVRKAIGNSTYHCVEEFNKLPPIIQKCVGSANQLNRWAMTENLNYAVVSSNFMRSYKTMVQRENEYSMYPEDIKQMIDKANIQTVQKIEENTYEEIEDKKEYVHMPDRIKEKLKEMKSNI